MKLINLTKCEIVHPHFNLDYSFGSKPMFFYSSPSGLAMPFIPGPIKEKFQADDFDSLSEGIALHDEAY